MREFFIRDSPLIAIQFFRSLLSHSSFFNPAFLNARSQIPHPSSVVHDEVSFANTVTAAMRDVPTSHRQRVKDGIIKHIADHANPTLCCFTPPRISTGAPMDSNLQFQPEAEVIPGELLGFETEVSIPMYCELS